MPQLRGFASIARQNPAVVGHASSATVFSTTGVALRDLNAVLSMVELKDDPCRDEHSTANKYSFQYSQIIKRAI